MSDQQYFGAGGAVIKLPSGAGAVITIAAPAALKKF
jgi:hypothetical protein